MKIQVVSDLHIEWNKVPSIYKDIIETESDVLVLAGDIDSHRNILKTLMNFQRDSGKDIIFVPGNHSYYGTSRYHLDPLLIDIHECNDNIHVLIEDSVCIGGVAFLGSTGWWDGSNGIVNDTVKRGLNDFKYIFDLCNEGSEDGIVWGKKSYQFFKDMFESGELYEVYNGHRRCDRIVCITHHMPSRRCIAPQFYGNPINTCFANEWTDLIERYQPDVWINGHTHTSHDFKINNTRMICNPQGYPSVTERYVSEQIESCWMIENSKFNPQLVIEI